MNRLRFCWFPLIVVTSTYFLCGNAELLKSFTRRHCGDILNNFKINENIVANIQIDGIDVPVYCDMETNGGGWTLISGGQIDAYKTFNEFKNGFGNHNERSYWLGLENIYQLTNAENMSIMIKIEYCKPPPNVTVNINNVTTYFHDSFKILNEKHDYAVVMRNTSKGSVPDMLGWQGSTNTLPKFQTYDRRWLRGNKCMKMYDNMGWWYGKGCVKTNLHAQRPYTCEDLEEGNRILYVRWNGVEVKNAEIYIRPRDFRASSVAEKL